MKVMTFNVLCAGVGENHWCRRQALVKDMIKKYDPDTFGIQEAHYGWMRYLVNQFKDIYTYVGVGKDDGKIKGEFSPVFYKKDKFELIEEGNFWLSETPGKPSLGWDSAENRTCAYAVLRDKKTGEISAHLNTHLDHIGGIAQSEGVRLIVERVDMFNNVPVVLMGDFNVTPDSDAYKIILDSGFDDARTVAECADDINSFHWFGNSSKMIDFIFIKNGIKVKNLKTATDMIGGKYPSDHYPVVAEFE